MSIPSFITLTKRMNSNMIGVVSGPDFKHPSMPFCYIGKAEDGKLLGFIQKYAFDKLMIYGEKIEDYIFSREDVAESKVIGTNVPFSLGSQTKIGTKYEVSFKNGKNAIITVVADQAQIVDNVLM